MTAQAEQETAGLVSLNFCSWPKADSYFRPRNGFRPTFFIFENTFRSLRLRAFALEFLKTQTYDQN